MNGYAQLSHLKADIEGSGLDAVYVRAIEEVSREFDGETRRPMFAAFATRYVNAYDHSRDSLYLDQDLLSLTTLKFDDDGDYTYGLTLAANTDYWPWPEAAPYRRLDLNSRSASLTTWDPGRRRVQVVGLWGYSYETERSGWACDEALDTSETDITLQDVGALGSAISLGETIVIDSEQMYVTAIQALTLTVVRGINGTTAAAHDDDTVIYRRRYPRDVERGVKERVAALRWDSQGGYAGEEGGSPDRAAYARWRQLIGRYRIPVVG